jgi:hypothetical protein
MSTKGPILYLSGLFRLSSIRVAGVDVCILLGFGSVLVDFIEVYVYMNFLIALGNFGVFYCHCRLNFILGIKKSSRYFSGSSH